MTDKLLTIDQAAAILGLRPSTLYTWASERRIRTVTIGRALRIRLSVVEELIRACDRPALAAVRLGGPRTERRSERP